MPIHDLQHHLRLGDFRTFCASVPLGIPCPLRFVKDNYSLFRLPMTFSIKIVGEPMNVVDERPNFYFGLSARSAPFFDSAALDHIAHERLLNYLHERPIARKKQTLILDFRTMNGVKPDQRLAGSGYSRSEANDLLVVLSSVNDGSH